MIKRIIGSTAILLFFAISANAQKESLSSYETSAGFKFYPGAITVKHFIKDKVAVEGLAYLFDRGFRVAGLYEFHSNIDDIEGLKWYVGPGLHLGSYNSKYGGGSSFGFDGVLGLDYKIKSAPINLSLDWQPSFEVASKYEDGFEGSWGGLSIRYTF